MSQREVIGTIEPGSGQRVTARAVAMLPGETYAQAVARQDERSARIKARIEDLRKCNLSQREAEAQAEQEAA